MTDQSHYDDTPEVTDKGGKSKALATYDAFTAEMKVRETEFVTLLPSTLSKDRFMNTAIAAVRQKPELLNCTPRSLFQALIRAALDGLLPDGKEGVINAYNTKVKAKVKSKWEEWYELQAQWMPMAAGFRKRARELDNIIIDAQEVYENDKFQREQGDEPKIIHIPAPFGKDRGKMVGAYAVFKKDGVILHRETMDARDIETVREQSRQPDSLMWKTFTSEAYKKTVLRRGIKSVPVSDRMAEIIQRDDEANFDFSQDKVATTALVPPPAPPAAPALEDKQQVPMATVKAEAEPVTAKKTRGKAKSDKAAEPTPEPQPEPEPTTERFPPSWNDYLDMQASELRAEEKPAMQSAIRETVADAVQGATERGEISRDQAEAIMEKWEELSKDA